MKLSFSLVAALAWLTPFAVRAEPASAEVLGQADAHFKQGVQLFKQARYDAALAEFRKAHELVPSFRVLYNIGRSCDELHDAACAVAAFEGYLQEGAKELPVERRADVQSALLRLTPGVGSLTLVVVGEGAELTLDDAPLAPSAVQSPIRVNVGKHRVVARFGDQIDARSVEVASGEEQRVELRAPAAAPAPPAAAVVPAAPLPVSEPARSAPRAPAVQRSSGGPVWIGWAASGAFLAAGVTTGALALKARGDARDIVNAGSELDSANRKMHRLALVSDVLTGAAIVTAGVSLYFTLHQSAVASVSLAIAPNNVRLGATF